MQSLDIVRAAAIIFVILGHALIYAKCANFLMGCIYSFHMALLFALSGFVNAASWERSGAAGPGTALRKIGKSAKRLLIPYALCGIAVVPMVNVMQTGRFAESFLNGWRNAFLLNRFLWYLPCCFFLICIFAAVTLIARNRIGGRRWIFATTVAAMIVVTAHALLPEVDYIRSVMNYMPAFFAGAWLWPHRGSVLKPGRMMLACSTAAFVALAVLFATLPSIPHFDKNVINHLRESPLCCRVRGTEEPRGAVKAVWNRTICPSRRRRVKASPDFISSSVPFFPSSRQAPSGVIRA